MVSFSSLVLFPTIVQAASRCAVLFRVGLQYMCFFLRDVVLRCVWFSVVLRVGLRCGFSFPMWF